MKKDLNDYIKSKCLKRAQRYWSMDPDELDKLTDGETEDTEDEED